MKCTILFLFLFTFSSIHAQSVFGKWKTMNKETGKPKSVVKVYEKNGKVFGDVVRIFNPAHRNDLCTNCSGDNHNKPIKGMTILKDLTKNGSQFVNGVLLDTDCGMTYRTKIWLNEDNPNILNVRKYIGLMYQTQNWIRVKKSNKQ